MATIYLSSTYADLKACREAIYHVLRRMRHDVIAMEDYVAADERPTEKCLTDVAASDLYIGIFAWRYGHIPGEMNPEHKSITELEYRQAQQTGKSCLLFLLEKDAPWPPSAMDVVTGEGKRGKYIAALRHELAQGKIVSFFQTPEELASIVSTAVSNWEKSRPRVFPSNALSSLGDEQPERVSRDERLKALILDHNSFIQSRLESFVGRAQELATIRRDIRTLVPTGGYLTITGQAGQGKSSIIAHLVQDSHPNEVAHHFIPFNPGPDHQVSLLRDLMAQLILKHDLSDYYVASESRPALRDFFPKVLDAIAVQGKQKVIFIDGLDQLKEDTDGERDLSFLPDNPPEGIAFVLGSRPNETLHQLELRKPLHTYHLQGITRHDFDLILQHRNVRLELGLADRFYKVMGENALYLDLVAKELAQAGAVDPEAIIERIADDPENIFSLTTTRLKRHAVEWREVLKPLLGVLLVACEPLTGRQLRSILDLDDERLREGIARLGGLVANDGKNRYTLFHLKLYDYLRQDKKRPHKEYIFARDEEEGWHDTLARWCERGDLSLIWEQARHDSVEQERREYARKHYVTHLYLSHEWQQPQKQRLFEVLDTVQYGQAKIRDDPSTHSYSLDLDLGRQATMWEGWTREEGMSLLPRLWQYTLLRCGLTSRADRYPETAFRLLVLLGRRQEAFGLAELLTDPARKVRVLLQIAEQIRQQANKESEWLDLLMRAGDVARTIQGSSRQAEALSALGSALAQAQQWTEAERVISMIQSRSQHARALSALGSALAQAQQWTEAERVIGTIQDRSQHARALRELDTALAQQWELASQVWAEALSELGMALAQALQLEHASQVWAEALSELGSALAQAQQLEHASQVWAEAERIIGTIQDHSRHARALRELGSALAQAQQWEHASQVWAEAERVIGTIQDRSRHAEALRELGSALVKGQQWEHASQVWAEAERVIGTIQDRSRHAEALRELGMALAHSQQWAEAERVIGTIQDSYQHAEALSALGSALVKGQQWEHASQVWAEAERVISTIWLGSQQARALSELGMALAQAQQWAEAERIIDTIQDYSRHAEALSALGSTLAQAQQLEHASQVWAEAERVIGTIQDRFQQARALSELGMALAQAQQWAEAERVISTIWLGSRHAEALSELGMALAHSQQWEHASQVWAEAERVIGTIQGRSQHAEALRELSMALAQAQQWAEAERVISTIQDSSQHAEALRELGSALVKGQQWEHASQVWAEAERVIGTIQGRDVQAEALRELGTTLVKGQQWAEAERVIDTIHAIFQFYGTIQDRDAQARALSALSTTLAQAQQWAEAERVISTIQDRNAQARALMKLSSALAQAQQWAEAERVISTIQGRDARARALRELGSALVKAQQWTEAKRVIGTIQGRSQQAKALSALGTTLAQAQQWAEAKRVISTIQGRDAHARALSALGSALAQAQQWAEAERVISTIQDRSQQAEALSALGSALVKGQQWEHASQVWAEAERVISTIQDRNAHARALMKLSSAMASADEFEQLLHVIQRAWRQVETREEALTLFSIASAFISRKPEVGIAFFDAFTWVDTFLGGWE